MSRGMTGQEPDPEQVYADIFDHPRHVSKRHPPMSLQDRAAQFAPFAALTGYEDMIGEEARPVDRRIELSEEEIRVLNETVARLQQALENGETPKAEITWFIPDPLKAGGRYETAAETIRRIDTVRGVLILARTEGRGNSYAEIPLRDLLEIHESPSPAGGG